MSERDGEAPRAEEDMTVEEAEELEMELELASFEASLPDDVEMRDTHRVAFRAGFTQARRVDGGSGPESAVTPRRVSGPIVGDDDMTEMTVAGPRTLGMLDDLNGIVARYLKGRPIDGMLGLAFQAAWLKGQSRAAAEPGELVLFFREEETAWGLKGDYENWSTQRAAIELIRELRAQLAARATDSDELLKRGEALRWRLKQLPDCPKCAGQGGWGPGGFYEGEWQAEMCEECGGSGKSLALIDVVAAIRHDPARPGQFWLCRRNSDGAHGGLHGMWEYPGGKVEPGEQLREALVRELQEEFGIQRPLIGAVLDSITYGPYRVTFFEVLMQDPAELYCHTEARWMTPAEACSVEHLPSGTIFNAKHLAVTPPLTIDLMNALKNEVLVERLWARLNADELTGRVWTMDECREILADLVRRSR